MEFYLRRYDGTPERTLGRLFVENQSDFLCFTLEDAIHDGPKIPGQTAIPAGRYRVIVTMSQRFGRMMPLLVDVPDFEGVRLHGGNTTADTAGCPLLGMTRTENAIANCAPALAKVQGLIADGLAGHHEVWITVTDPLPKGTLVT